MILKVYAVYDHAARAFLPPFYQHNDNMAKRAFMESAQNPEHQFCKHAEDFHLAVLGEFDDSSGMITSLKQTKWLAYATGEAQVTQLSAEEKAQAS